MKNPETPTVGKTILVLGIALGVMGVFVWGFNVSFPGMTEIVQRRLGQSGLLLTYCGALLGAHGLFWNEAYANAKTVAESKIAAVNGQIALLESIKGKFDPSYFANEDELLEHRKKEATDSLAQATQPAAKKFSGRAGIALIMIGTCLQFASLG